MWVFYLITHWFYILLTWTVGNWGTSRGASGLYQKNHHVKRKTSSHWQFFTAYSSGLYRHQTGYRTVQPPMWHHAHYNDILESQRKLNFLLLDLWDGAYLNLVESKNSRALRLHRGLLWQSSLQWRSWGQTFYWYSRQLLCFHRWPSRYHGYLTLCCHSLWQMGGWWACLAWIGIGLKASPWWCGGVSFWQNHSL